MVFSGPWSDTTSTFQSMSLDDDDDEPDEVRLQRLTRSVFSIIVQNIPRWGAF